MLTGGGGEREGLAAPLCSACANYSQHTPANNQSCCSKTGLQHALCPLYEGQRGGRRSPPRQNAGFGHALPRRAGRRRPHPRQPPCVLRLAA